MARKLVLWSLCALVILFHVGLAAFDCSLFATQEAALDGGVKLVKDYVAAGDVAFDNE